MQQCNSTTDIRRTSGRRRAGRIGGAAAILVAAGLLLPWSGGGAVATAQSQDAASLARRRAWLKTLQEVIGPSAERFTGRLTAVDKSWEDWVARTGELPPDFDQMPSQPFLPDPLVPLGNPRGPRITKPDEWAKQRTQIRAAFEKWVYGTMPPSPGNVRATVVGTTHEGDVTVQQVLLEFGPDHKGKLRLEMFVPPGAGPFPVFMTNHPRRRPWVNIAVRRGYIACLFHAADPYYGYLGVEDDAEAFVDLYPDYDFSMIGRWAWGAMRAVDYLVTRPDVNPRQLSISGHSRNSKGALLAAALDERIGAVVPSRGNNGDQIPWRFTNEVYVTESVQEITTGMPNWFHPRLRFFAGHEDKLPVDQNMLAALVAPRGFLFSHAFTEHQGNVLGIEEAYRSVKSVYHMLGHEDRLGLYQQPGEHDSSPEDVEVYFDFFDTVFGRGKLPIPEIWVRNYTYDKWLRASGEKINPVAYPVRKPGDFLMNGSTAVTAADWPARRAAIQKRLRWALGEEPAGMPLPGGGGFFGAMTSTGYLGALLMRPSQGSEARSLGFGDNLSGEIYLPDGYVPTRRGNFRNPTATPPPPTPPAQKRPAVIWLHPYSYATGYSRYAMWTPLTKAGFFVLTLDQIGFGSRNDEVAKFYDRYPHWSLFGKMVADVRAAITTAQGNDEIDASRIYVMGYGLGGKLALTVAALDDRVRGAVSISGFAPLRLDTPQKGTEGVRHYSDLHGLMPRFGFFAGHEDRLPIDFDEILAAAAPKPLWIGAPTLDRFNPVADVRIAVQEASRAYALVGATQMPVLRTPVALDGLPEDALREATLWLTADAGLPAAVPPVSTQAPR